MPTQVDKAQDEDALIAAGYQPAPDKTVSKEVEMSLSSMSEDERRQVQKNYADIIGEKINVKLCKTLADFQEALEGVPLADYEQLASAKFTDTQRDQLARIQAGEMLDFEDTVALYRKVYDIVIEAEKQAGGTCPTRVSST